MARNRRVNLSVSNPQSTTEYPPESLDFQSAITAFIRYCRIRNLTDKTLTYYRDTSRELVRLLAELGVFRPIDVTKNTMLNVIEAKKTQKIQRGKGSTPTDATMNKYLRGWRALFNWLHTESYLSENPFAGIGVIKSERRIIETFTKDQIAKLLAVPNRATFTGYRDYTIILTLLDCGIRISELAALKLTAINWSERTFKVYGKGRKERLVPFSRTLDKALRLYVEMRGVLETDVLFVNIDNNPYQVRGIQWALKQYGAEAKIKGVRVSPHTLRHTFAKMYIMNGGDAFSLQKILGHTSLEIVRMYVNLFSSDVSAQHAKYSPLDRM